MFNVHHYMFSYGMNTHINSMRARCPSAKWVAAAFLPEHRFEFRYHADVDYDPTDRVYGVLWQMDQAAMDAIDHCEGYPDYYDREQLWVEVEGGLQYQAWVYKMRDDSDLHLPSQHYLDLVEDGYIMNDLPRDQIYNAMERCYARNYQGA